MSQRKHNPNLDRGFQVHIGLPAESEDQREVGSRNLIDLLDLEGYSPRLVWCDAELGRPNLSIVRYPNA